MNRPSRHQVNKETPGVNDTLNQIEIIRQTYKEYSIKM